MSNLYYASLSTGTLVEGLRRVPVLRLGNEDIVRLLPQEARQLAQDLHDCATVADVDNGEPGFPGRQNLLIGSRIGDDGSPIQVAVIPTFGPAFYTDAAGARHLAARLRAHADELGGGEAEAPLPEPCPLCNGTSRATYNPFEDQFDAGGQDACPICSPEDPEPQA